MLCRQDGLDACGDIIQLKTRKPSLEVVPTTLVTFLDNREFSAGWYLFAVSNSGLPFSYGPPGFPKFTFTFQSQRNIFIPWSWTLTYNVDLRIWPRKCQGEPASHLYLGQRLLCSKVIVCTQTHHTENTHTHTPATDCSTRPLKCK